MSFGEVLQEQWEAQTHTDDTNMSETNMELAALWLETCHEEHHGCALEDLTNGPAPLLPTRAIDVQASGSNPLLYAPAQPERADYVALSHCWGRTKPLAIELGQGDISRQPDQNGTLFALPPLADWPRSFRDAVDIVRSLNVKCSLNLKYLWIDNACILQGNADDWASESQRMANYFGNATITLASAWAESDHMGISIPRNPLFSRPLQLKPPEIRSKQSTRFHVHVKADRSSPYGLNPELYHRAWVLQEESLSRRVLQFGKDGISWKCFSISRASETVPDGQQVQAYQHNLMQGRTLMRAHLRLADHGMMYLHTRNPYYDLWYRCVDTFSGRNMMYKKDVLPALSGLAQTFQPFMEAGDQYVAGLWKSDITLGLLWVADTIGWARRIVPAWKGNFLVEGFSGPSWSWINRCDKRIGLFFDDKILPGNNYDYQHSTSVVGTQILNVSVDLRRAAEPYGEVRGGTIQLAAKIQNLIIDDRPHERTHQEKEHVEYVSRYHLLTHVRRVTMASTAFPKAKSPFQGTLDLDDIESPIYRKHVKNGHVTAAFVPMILHSTFNCGPDNLVGLALLPTGTKENEYARIGRVCIAIKSYVLQECTIAPQEITIV